MTVILRSVLRPHSLPLRLELCARVPLLALPVCYSASTLLLIRIDNMFNLDSFCLNCPHLLTEKYSSSFSREHAFRTATWLHEGTSSAHKQAICVQSTDARITSDTRCCCFILYFVPYLYLSFNGCIKRRLQLLRCHRLLCLRDSSIVALPRHIIIRSAPLRQQV
jgi:hypothetical protein